MPQVDAWNCKENLTTLRTAGGRTFANEHMLDSFPFLSFMKKAAMTICVQVFVWICSRFLWVYIQEWNCWITWKFYQYILLLKELPNYKPFYFLGALLKSRIFKQPYLYTYKKIFCYLQDEVMSSPLDIRWWHCHPASVLPKLLSELVQGRGLELQFHQLCDKSISVYFHPRTTTFRLLKITEVLICK